MDTESIITIITSVLGSGVISLILQRHWAMVDAKKAEKQSQSMEARRERDARDRDSRMLKKIFRINLNRTIIDVRRHLEDPTYPDSRLRLDIRDLKDDMQDYFDMGGNGGTHAAYVELYKELSDKKPDLISEAWLEFIAKDIE